MLGDRFVFWFFNLLSPFFSRSTIIMIKDLITLLSGAFVILVLAVFWASKVLVNTNLEWRKFESPKMLVVRVKKGEYKRTYIKKPQNTHESFMLLLAIIVAKFRRFEGIEETEISYHDVATFNNFIKILAILGIVLIIMTCLLIAHPLPYPGRGR